MSQNARARTLFAITAAFAAAFGGYVAAFRWSVHKPVRVLYVAATSGQQAIQANARAVIGNIRPYPGQISLGDLDVLPVWSDEVLRDLQDRLRFATPAMGYRIDLAEPRRPGEYRGEWIESGLDRFARRFKDRGLIILDPFYSSASFRDLNSPAEVGRVMSGLAQLAREYSCAVLLLLPEREKFRKRDDPAPLGTTRIAMDADTVIRLEPVSEEQLPPEHREHLAFRAIFEQMRNARPDVWPHHDEAQYIYRLDPECGWTVTGPRSSYGRKDLTPVAFQDAYLNPAYATLEDVGEVLGRAKSTISHRASGLSLPPREDLLSGKAHWPVSATAEFGWYGKSGGYAQGEPGAADDDGEDLDGADF